MERVLEKMASQLNVYDEASIMDLWGKYAEEVSSFEPTKKWEQACIIFCMIQSIRWKNQLFNYHVKNYSNASLNEDKPTFIQFTQEPAQEKQEKKQPAKKAKILHFPKNR